MLFFNVEFTIAVTIKFMSELLPLEDFGSESQRLKLHGAQYK